MFRAKVALLTLFLVVLCCTCSVLMQTGVGDQLAKAADNAGNADQQTEMRAYVRSGSRHRLQLDPHDDLYAELLRKAAVVNEIDYGSFKLIEVEDPGNDPALFAKLPEVMADYMDQIYLNGYVIDTTQAEAVYAVLPESLRNPDIAQALAGSGAPKGGLYLIQFAGPIKDEWLDTLKAQGIEVVAYVPANAYVVRADSQHAWNVAALKQQNPYVRFVGDYEPAFRLTPTLRELASQDVSKLVDVTVQVINGPGGTQTINKLKEVAQEVTLSYRILNYRNVELKVEATRLAEIAQYDNVFGIEERGERWRADEAQGQIVAGNLSGNVPTGPGYLSWLASKGFTSSQFTTFVVNIVDDTYTLSGHPDLPASRVAFVNNPTNQTGTNGGHGFINTGIAAGISNGIGSTVEDASGFNYGLGIAPFAHVGATAIFGDTSSSGTVWENTAYGQGSRISSNSWVFRTLAGAPVPRYDANAQAYDAIVRDAQSGTTGLQQLTVVFAAGNFGSGANTVSSPATAKNVICVGASENVRQTGTDGCGIANTGADSANDIISFSSRGPVNSTGGDGRIKPDIVAPGTHIEAGVPQSNYDGSGVCNQFWPAGQTLYGWSSGTSHSCPAVAGGAALVYQDFLNKGLAAPTPAMVKATLMNAAAYMSGVGAGGNLPSNSQGMGRMDLGRAFDTTPRIRVDQTQVLGATGQTYQVTGTVADTTKPFRVTLAWSDAPGPTTGAPWVNNLDLEVTVGSVTYKGNVFSGANSISGGTADAKNNAESVFLPAGTSGSFTITVKATNIAGDGVPGNGDTTDQDFALVAYNARPVLLANPSDLGFTAVEGGPPNPPDYSFNLTSSTSSAISWSLTKTGSWFSVSATSGTTPATVRVQPNVTVLPAGTYFDSITVTASGAANNRITIPVHLVVNPFFTNGGFEARISPWVLSGQAYWANGIGGTYMGAGYLSLGRLNPANGAAYQQVTVPAGGRQNLRFFLNVVSTETTTVLIKDRLFVEVRDTNGNLLSTLATFTNLNHTPTGAYIQRGPYSLAGFAGRVVRVQFRVANDNTLSTDFRIDQLSAN